MGFGDAFKRFRADGAADAAAADAAGQAGDEDAYAEGAADQVDAARAAEPTDAGYAEGGAYADAYGEGDAASDAYVYADDAYASGAYADDAYAYADDAAQDAYAAYGEVAIEPVGEVGYIEPADEPESVPEPEPEPAPEPVAPAPTSRKRKVRKPWRAWAVVARIVFAIVFVVNIMFALGLVATPGTFAATFELEGTAADVLVRLLGLALVMWSVAWLPVVVAMRRFRALGVVLLFQQFIAVVGLLAIAMSLPSGYDVLFTSVMQLFAFEIVALIAMSITLIGYMWTGREKARRRAESGD